MVASGDRVIIRAGKYRGHSGTVKTVGSEYAVVVIDDSTHSVGFAFKPDELEVTLAAEEWKVSSQPLAS